MSTEPDGFEETPNATPEPADSEAEAAPEAAGPAPKPRSRRAKAKPADEEPAPEAPASVDEAQPEDVEEGPIIDAELSEEASVLVVEALMGSPDEAAMAQPLPPTVLEFLQQAVQAVGSRDRKGRITPALWRQIGKAANTICDALEIADVAPQLLDTHAPTLLRLAVLMGTDPGRKKAAQKALAGMIRRERKALAAGLEE